MMEDSKLAMAALEAHTATLGYRLTGEQGENWCNVYNDGIAELVKKYPDRFVGMASVPLQDPARAAKVLERAVRDLNFRGGYIGTNVNGNYYNSDRFRSVLGQSPGISTSWSSCIPKMSPAPTR